MSEAVSAEMENPCSSVSHPALTAVSIERSEKLAWTATGTSCQCASATAAATSSGLSSMVLAALDIISLMTLEPSATFFRTSDGIWCMPSDSTPSQDPCPPIDVMTGPATTGRAPTKLPRTHAAWMSYPSRPRVPRSRTVVTPVASAKARLSTAVRTSMVVVRFDHWPTARPVGSLVMWTCMSIKPGIANMPEASSRPWIESGGGGPSMSRPPAMWRSPTDVAPLATSTIVQPVIDSDSVIPPTSYIVWPS